MWRNAFSSVSEFVSCQQKTHVPVCHEHAVETMVLGGVLLGTAIPKSNFPWPVLNNGLLLCGGASG